MILLAVLLIGVLTGVFASRLAQGERLHDVALGVTAGGAGAFAASLLTHAIELRIGAAALSAICILAAFHLIARMERAPVVSPLDNLSLPASTKRKAVEATLV
jgi:uncharacterized membrane protein YeaQ/YmgE (transglycosylase-associated protein family)